MSDLNITCLQLNSYRSSKKTALQRKKDGSGGHDNMLRCVMLKGTGDTFSNMLALQKAGVSVHIFFYHQEGRRAGKKIKQSEE